jgi:hypothetical protein
VPEKFTISIGFRSGILVGVLGGLEGDNVLAVPYLLLACMVDFIHGGLSRCGQESRDQHRSQAAAQCRPEDAK